jgi:MFS superfamily sulfate permease-like transporter
LKKSTKIGIISGIAVAIVVSTLIIIVHLRQSAIEVTEKGNETTSQKINEAINAITNQNTAQNKTAYSESGESAMQRASEGK